MSGGFKSLLAWSGKHRFFFICLAAVLVRFAFVLIVPVGEAPDEHHHLWVIQFMRENLRLPDAGDVKAGGIDAVYGSLPQLGYLPHVFLARLFPDEHLVLLSRCASLLMGLITIWAGFRAGTEIFPDQPLLASALPWVMVFHPQFAFVHSYSNNDSTAGALAAVVLYLLVLTLKSGLAMKRCALIGALLGLLVLSKYNGLSLIPVAALSVVAAAWIHGASVAACLSCLLLVAAAGAATSLWWFWRNAHEYGLADILGIKTGYQTFARGFNRPLSYKMSPFELLASKQWWRFLFFSFWGLFGHMTRWLWRPIYFIYLGFVAAAIVGWVRTRFALPAARIDLAQPAIRLMFALCILVNFTLMIASQMGGPQGRYFFICEIPIIALLLDGLFKLGPRFGRPAVLAFLGLNVAVCIGAWIMLLRLYGLPSHLPS